MQTRAADFALRAVDDRLREFNSGHLRLGSREVTPNRLASARLRALVTPGIQHPGQSRFEPRVFSLLRLAGDARRVNRTRVTHIIHTRLRSTYARFDALSVDIGQWGKGEW